MDFDKLAAPLVQVYEEVTDQIIENIARHFNTGKNLPTIEWQMQKLAEMGQLRQENIRIIARKTRQNPELIKIALENAAAQALKHAEPQLKEAARRGYLHDGGPLEMSSSVSRVLTSYQRQAEDTANLVNTVMLESGLQSYRRVVSDVVQYEQAAMAVTQADAAQNILNTETAKVLTGVSSRQEALRRAIKRMADNGLTGFVDRGGHNWQPETYINMDIRSTCGNVATEAVFARNEDYGNDLFWVTVKATARPLCYPWQGKVISRNDRSGYVEDLDGNRIEIIPISSTSYGEPAGLYGINCGHTPPNVFTPGITKIRGEVPDKAENDKRYAESQEQRRIERKIRYAKREAAALEAAGLDATDAYGKVEAAQAEMRAFINRTGRTRRSDREQISGWGQRQAAQSAGIAEKHHAEWLKSIGAQDTELKTVAKYYEAKYNSSPEYSLLKQYAKDVQSGWVSPLSGFGNYKQLHNRIESEIVGRTTSTGMQITGQRAHFIQRVVGTPADPEKTKKDLRIIRRSGVSIDSIKDALFTPEDVDPPVTRADGKRSVRFIGKGAIVTVNPDTGELIQTNPRKKGKENA